MASKEPELYTTEGDYGVRTLSEPSDAIVDIIFVHGLTGNRETTWTDQSTKKFWPLDFLPEDIPNARIITWGYDADVVKAFGTASSNHLRHHANTLALDITNRRLKSKTDDRPIIFVAHSLGGLVVEQTLLLSRDAPKSQARKAFDSTHGIIFMGTPHHGSDKEKWREILTQFTRLFRETNQAIVQVLRPGSEMLASVTQTFHTMLDSLSRNQQKHIEIFCFFEEKATSKIGMIVPHHSAILERHGNAGINATHSGMTKFATNRDAGYKRVSETLYSWVDDISKTANSQQELSPEQIRQKRLEVLEPQANQELYSWSGNVNSQGGKVVC